MFCCPIFGLVLITYQILFFAIAVSFNRFLFFTLVPVTCQRKKKVSFSACVHVLVYLQLLQNNGFGFNHGNLYPKTSEQEHFFVSFWHCVSAFGSSRNAFHCPFSLVIKSQLHPFTPNTQSAAAAAKRNTSTPPFLVH